MHPFFAVAISLFFAIDSLGGLPTYVHLLKNFDVKKQRWIAYRELGIALVIMLFFQLLGDFLLPLLALSSTAVRISGGIVLFLIAIRLIFGREEEREKMWKEGNPFIVPIAVPLIAGPSVLTIIMIYSQKLESTLAVSSAILVAWALSSLIFLNAKKIYKVVGDRGLSACEKLMGLILALIAIQTLLEGIQLISKAT